VSIIEELRQRDLLTMVEREAAAYHTNVDELLSKTRDSLAIQARHSVWRKLFADPEVVWSISRIAKLFRVDRSTVANALNGRRRAA